MEINKAEVFGEAMVRSLEDMAADYQELADGLHRLAADVPRIGQQRGLSRITAPDIALDAVRRINRGSLSLTSLVKAAAEYEKHVTGGRAMTTGRSELVWFYGPTAADPDPGKRWHTGCGGVVLAFDGGNICGKCDQQANDDEVVTEHAVAFKSGDMKIRCDAPEVEEVSPLAQWIVHKQRYGEKVYRRRVIVVDDWEEVPPADSAGLEVEP